MSFESLPDHYKALGLSKEADAATIKKTYRKLVLTCHPDKVTDQALKAQKQDEFHKIQQAYETLSDETRRETYHTELKLQQLRREKLARTASGTTVEPKSARFSQPTSGGGSYTANTSSRYQTEERKPSATSSSRHHDYEEERYHSNHKTDSYFSSPRRSSPRPTPSSRSSREKYEKELRREKPSDRTRSSATKARDSERRDRTGRFPVDSDGSSGEDRAARYEREHSYKSRSAEDDSQRREERRRDDRRYEDYENTSSRKHSIQEDDAIRYIHKSRAEAEINLRPSPVRTTSRDYYDTSSRSSRHREVRPEAAPRRSSARPKERPSIASRRDTDRGIPDIVDWDDRRPSFKQSASSPADIRIPTMPTRSATDSHRRTERSPPRFPGLSRSATAPIVPGSEAGGARRDAKSYPRPSGLRNEANSSPERGAYPTIPAPQSSSKTYYTYSPGDGGVKPMDHQPPHRTILREPERVRHRSPSPIGKPPMGANRPGLYSSKTYAPGRTSRQSSPVREERGRTGRMYYGEQPSEYTRKKGTADRQTEYSTHNVSYAPSIGPEDIRWAPRRGDDRYSDRKPTLGRTTTSVY
ncbi:molecular chaperone DnaJ [Stagonosporopsis vannaccii]|nr:molecular chaperone DnaJ [Stagonosporopsis vannaccii]